jgi:hypothetical protein
MKKITKFLEQIELENYYKGDVKMTVMVKASSEGEAGYLIDDMCKNVENTTHYEITTLELSTKQEYDNAIKETSLQEMNKVGDLTPEQFLTNEWINTSDDQFEFYHKMRNEGYDGFVILNIVNKNPK